MSGTISRGAIRERKKPLTVVLHGLLRHGERDSVHELVLENDTGVGVSDTGLGSRTEQTLVSKLSSATALHRTKEEADLKETLGVLGRVRRDDLESRDGSVPSSEALRVLSGNTHGRSVGSSERDGARDISTRHVVGLSSGVDDLVDGLHGEVADIRGIKGGATCQIEPELGGRREREGGTNKVMNSQTGRRPASPAPTARPANPDSDGRE